ncbi:MAG: outer membrane beta-barrel domain-containing protein [Polyangiales bacterium]
MPRTSTWRAGLALTLALLATTSVLGSAVSVAEAQCIDEAIEDELNARRRYRGVEERLFRKAMRHELSIMGGGYMADLLSSWWLASGAYTFHVTESIGLEASFGFTRAKSDVLRTVEADLGTTLVRIDTPVFLYMGHLLWSMAYGKMRWFGGRISRFDLYLALGGGVTDNQTAAGLTFSGGLGLKLYFNSWFSMRFDVRNQVLSQELLGRSQIVDNLAVTLGLSVFLPPRY